MFNETESSITLINPIKGVEIEATWDSVDNVWRCRDGYNSAEFATKDEARKWLADAVDYYSSEASES